MWRKMSEKKYEQFNKECSDLLDPGTLTPCEEVPALVSHWPRPLLHALCLQLCPVSLL